MILPTLTRTPPLFSKHPPRIWSSGGNAQHPFSRKMAMKLSPGNKRRAQRNDESEGDNPLSSRRFYNGVYVEGTRSDDSINACNVPRNALFSALDCPITCL